MTTLEKLDETKKINSLRRNLKPKENQDIPTFDKFSKMNFVSVGPRKFSHAGSSSSQAKQNTQEMVKNVLTESKYEKPVKKKLREIYKEYYERFETICKDVIDMKYSNIFDEIYHFLLFMKYCEDPILRTIVINTDQNANDFFYSMEQYFMWKYNYTPNNDNMNNRIIFVADEKFKDMKGLFKFLNICDDRTGFETKEQKKFERLIVLREIQKIDKTSLNLLISRLIDYHQYEYRIFTNIIVFDVSYDPRGLYDKIKPNHLCKMTFSNVENIPSRNIYQEVLYKFIYENSNNLFIPNSTYLKKIVDYANNHQISVKSFKHYFKFLIIDFFLIGSWSRDEYLLYHPDLIQLQHDKNEENNKKKNNNIYNPVNQELSSAELEKFFYKEIKKIYSSTSSKKNSVTEKVYSKEDVDHLVRAYKTEKENRELFFTFYKFLEDLVLYLNTMTKRKMYTIDKYQFFFDFLQLGMTPDKVTEFRTNLLRTSLNRIEDKAYVDITKDVIIKKFKLFLNISDDETEVNHMQIDSSSDDRDNLLKFLHKLEKLVKNSGFDEYHKVFNMSNSRSKSKTHFNHNNEDLPPLVTNEEFVEKLLKLFNEELFTLSFFSYMDKNENRKIKYSDPRIMLNSAKKYIIFSEVVNPSLNSIVIDILYSFEKILEDEAKKEKLKIKGKKVRINSQLDDTNLSVVEEPINSENFNENFKFSKLLKHFMILYSQAPVEFKLKYIFAEYLNQFGLDYENKEKVQKMRNHFLYFCHIFYLLGFISRKRTRNDVYIKNYFQMTNYFSK
jgi:hypothetical protein